MGKNVTLELDEETYEEMKRLAEACGGRLETALGEAIAAYLEQRKTYVNDPFFLLGRAGRSGLGDLAQAHDQYLYTVEDER